MRALEVLGLGADGSVIVCQDPSSGEEFSVAVDDKLRAAARGDLSRIGQLEIEMESQLRPKEIQARIRAGASVAEVAKAAGTHPSRIETFAHPVLMERSAIADRAASCMVDGSAVTTAVRDVVAARLADLGQSAPITWDAHRDQTVWVLTAQWSVGRSRNTAEFAFHPVAGGGTVIARNELAVELVRPERSPLRTVAAGSATGMARGLAVSGSADAVDATRPLPRLDATGAVIARTVAARAAESKPVESKPVESKPVESTPLGSTPAPAASVNTEESAAERLVAETVEDARAGAHPDRAAREPVARTGTDHHIARPTGGKAGKSAKPAMPSWDDVLLGGTRRR